jgi:2-C-methyl-D-erythritol 4-phosphate cytidylyltransferase
VEQSAFRLPLRDVICEDGINANEDEVICGLVLAGGEGKRLQPFIKSLGKGTLPKQYVNFIGSHSMLEHTIRRAEKIIPPERIFTVITASHLQYPKSGNSVPAGLRTL